MSQVDSLLEVLLTLERPLLLALDVDGTLAPIVRDPDLAEIPEQTLSTLAALAEVPTLELALITGRDLGSLQRMERLQGVWRAVEHGGVVLAPEQAPPKRELTSGPGSGRPSIGFGSGLMRAHTTHSSSTSLRRSQYTCGRSQQATHSAPISCFEKPMSSPRASAFTCGGGKLCAKPRRCVTTRAVRLGRYSTALARGPYSS